ncbi:putative Rhodanese-like domain-containing protein [Rosa chinensis]|uniref:Putative Rhodanese-like domain-containing protein n=1 Tax=Rosa chinensis TaxID=74649 RepID=A0A2P6PU96_ROSCH|nr:putative Rhodanese-like domain-containing protein [Rosa chinensis]
MDADGTRSKAIARSLRKLGLKMPYLLQGGFRSWVKDGLRIKELKPETTLTILNEQSVEIEKDVVRERYIVLINWNHLN